ncbi:MAG: hypothetical protein IAA73_08325 [Bacteroidetes bacterium]|uniref:Uncharacterized protein n=1 Tax=Candidatus Gallipaludibacter merdavium TaxID=2840839 RepID=A0A9D9N4L7_9BACT|nr:hypothetical protein [Candidatus Gallipaludibacter merdavium]
MKKKNDPKRKAALMQKTAVETLEFQTIWGLKQLGVDAELNECALAELASIKELGVTYDLLNMKRFAEGVRQALQADVVVDMGELVQSVVCMALGISRVSDVQQLAVSQCLWDELLKQKLLTVYYPADVRNEVVAWAMENGFTTSTYLGQPIIKFSKIFLAIKRMVK